MKPVKSFLFLLCACPFLVHAQTQAPSGPLYISLSTGMAIPVAGFGSKDAGTSGNNLAKVGTDQNIQVDYRVWRFISLTALGGYQTNNYNYAAFNASPQAKEAGVSMGVGKYGAKRLLGGFTLSYSIGNGDRWYFTDRVLAGVQYQGPFTRVAEGTGAPFDLLEEDFHNGFATEVGFGFNYRFSRFWYLESGADFFSSNSRLRDSTGPISTGNAVYGGNLTISTINLHLGIGARI